MTQLTEEHFHLIDSNKAKRHEQIKAERQVVYDNSNLGSKTKDRILKYVDDNSHNKTIGEIQSELKSIIHDFMNKEQV